MTKKSKVLAEGEATGHSHRVLEQDAWVHEDGGFRTMSAPSGATIVHEEHGKQVLPPGDYNIGIVQEFDPAQEAVRSVRD